MSVNKPTPVLKVSEISSKSLDLSSNGYYSKNDVDVFLNKVKESYAYILSILENESKRSKQFEEKANMYDSSVQAFAKLNLEAEKKIENAQREGEIAKQILIDEGNKDASNLKINAEKEINKVLDETTKTCQDMLTKATNDSNKILNDATVEASKILDNAKDGANKIVQYAEYKKVEAYKINDLINNLFDSINNLKNSTSVQDLENFTISLNNNQQNVNQQDVNQQDVNQQDVNQQDVNQQDVNQQTDINKKQTQNNVDLNTEGSANDYLLLEKIKADIDKSTNEIMKKNYPEE